MSRPSAPACNNATAPVNCFQAAGRFSPTAPDTLSGLGAIGNRAEATQFGNNIRASFVGAYHEAQRRILRSIGREPSVDDPFKEFDHLRHELFPITVANAEDHIVGHIIKDSYQTPPLGAEAELRKLLQVGMYAYSEKVGFKNPYELFPEHS